MLLEPGPIPKVDISGYPTTWEVPDFEAMTYHAWDQIDTLTLELDSLIDPAAVFDDVLTGDTIMFDLDTVDQINGDNAHLANLAPIPNIDGMKANGDTALVAAVQSIPGEAFTPVPATTQYGTVAQPAATARIAGVTLLNLTRMSGTDQRAGDQFQLQVHMDTSTGAATDYYAVHVWAELTRDQVQQPNLDLGSTDGTGYVTYKGQWQTSDVGNWTMFVHAQPTTGGDVVSQLYQWNVTDQAGRPGAPRPAAVSVQLRDWTSGDIHNAHVGDTWQVIISGPPNQPVFIWGTQNGAALAEVQLGSTDDNGNFTLAGTWTPAELGDWVEFYAVGRFQWPSSLAFTVAQALRPVEPPGTA
jgi:hypothetical protein